MTSTQVAALPTTLIAALNTQQILALDSAEVAALSPEQYTAISATNLTMLKDNGVVLPEKYAKAQGMHAPAHFSLSSNVSSLTNAISVFNESPQIELEVPKLLVNQSSSTNMGIAVGSLVNAINQFNINPIDNGVVANVLVLNGTQPQKDLTSLLAATRS